MTRKLIGIVLGTQSTISLPGMKSRYRLVDPPSATANEAWRLGRGSGGRGDDAVVRLENQIVQVTGRDGAKDRKLTRGVVSTEHVQGPIANSCSAQMRMVERCAEIRVKHDRRTSHAALLRPAELPRRTHPTIC